MAKLNQARSMGFLNLFLEEGFGEVEIRSMGGMYGVLSFLSKEAMSAMLKENRQ